MRITCLINSAISALREVDTREARSYAPVLDAEAFGRTKSVEIFQGCETNNETVISSHKLVISNDVLPTHISIKRHIAT
jgi:hypothetical protein